ncbi:MAG: FHA domain-containing protein [Phototrophicaceae bacterium]|jgi:pSer/pThr/pTyr-binding forkhead associated (FHA) protein
MQKHISVTYMSGPYDGKSLRFEQPAFGDELIINIGRREGCDIEIDFDNQVSRLHARLICQAVEVTATDSTPNPYHLAFWLEDVDSRNGTFIEKQSEPIKGRVELRPGILFKVGRTWMRLDVPFSFETTFNANNASDIPF